MHCIKAFLDYVEQSKPTCDGANGNSGYFTLVNSQNKEMSIYQYGRIDKKNNHVHSEEELIDILKKIKLHSIDVFILFALPWLSEKNKGIFGFKA